MGNIINFNACPLSGLTYSGSEYKIGIIYKGGNHIIKFPKVVNGVESYGYISEYLGSHIFSQLGVDVHDTMLGTYNGSNVVCLKDFTNGLQLVEFSGVGESSLDSSHNASEHLYEYSDILDMIYSNKKLINPDKAVERFWQMFVVDALLGNFDRHGYNWGYLRTLNDEYILAPVYDNGSCLFPRLNDYDIERILNNSEELDKRTYTFPTSQIKLNGKKSSYYDVISSGNFSECDNAIKWLVDRFDITSINNLIFDTPFLSTDRMHFLSTIIKYRFDKLIKSRMDDIVKRSCYFGTSKK